MPLDLEKFEGALKFGDFVITIGKQQEKKDRTLEELRAELERVKKYLADLVVEIKLKESGNGG